MLRGDPGRCTTCSATTCSASIAAILVAALVGWADEPNYLAKIKELGIPALNGKIPAYYSPGHQQHARQLQSAIEDMNGFYQSRLDVQTNVAALALLDSKSWTNVTGNPYGLPMCSGNPVVIFMPATRDNPTFGLMMARRQAIPPGLLQTFLKENDTTFDAVADQFVDLIGFHELGHTLTLNFGIDPKDQWFSEFLASYWSYAYISERHPEWKRVFDLLGRPSKVRPKNTSLEDLERLYTGVDDYGWYQGMFEARIREIYPRSGLKFLIDLRRDLPLTDSSPGYAAPVRSRMPPQELIERLEKIAPGFKEWAVGFNSSSQPATVSR